MNEWARLEKDWERLGMDGVGLEWNEEDGKMDMGNRWGRREWMEESWEWMG